LYFDYVINTTMNPYILNHQQKNLVHSEATLFNVTYRDVSEALHTVAMRVLKNCYEHKSTYLVIPDPEVRKQIGESLQTLMIDDLTLFVHLQKSVSEIDLNALRDKCGSKRTPCESKTSSGYLYDVLNDKIKNHYLQMHSKIIYNDKSWSKLLTRYLGLTEKNTYSVFNDLEEGTQLDFSKSEYDSISENISEALFLYQREFELTQISMTDKTLFHPSIDHRDDFHNISYTLYGFKQEACLLAGRYRDFISEIEQLHIKSSVKETDQIIDKINYLIYVSQLNEQETPDSNGFFSGLFTSQKNKKDNSLLQESNKLLDEIKDKGIVNLNYPKINNYGEIGPALRFMSDVMTSKRHQIPQMAEELIKSVNKLNYLDPAAENLEFGLNDLLERVNASNIFRIKHEFNTLSIKKQMEYLQHLIHLLETAILSIEKNINYYQWLKFLNTIGEKSKCIILHLKFYDPSDWQDLFKAWYLEKLLENNFPYTDITPEHSELLEQYLIEKEKFNVGRYKNRILEEFESKMTTIKKEHPELNSLLVKRKALKHPVLWKNFLATNTEMITAVYPVIVAESDDVPDLKTHALEEIIYLDFPGIKVDMMNVFKSTIFFFKEESFQGIPEYSLTKEPLCAFKTLQETHTTGKISLVRSITNELLQFGIQPAIYGLRDTTIISFCSDYYNGRLNDDFYNSGIKRLHGDNVRQTITGALLDDQKNIFILVEDELFNHDVDNYDFLLQKMTADFIVRMGCEWISLDNKNIYETKGTSLTDVFARIKLFNHTTIKNQNQLSIEFN
jgi:hypothetical protein